MNILCRNISEKHQEAMRYAKAHFKEKTISSTILKMLLRFRSLQTTIDNQSERISELTAEKHFLEHGLEKSKDILNETFEKMDENIKRYRILTGSLERSEDLEEE